MKPSWVQRFSPAWFAAVMGTGGFANVLYSWGGAWSGWRVLAAWLAAINAVALVVLLVPWVARWLAHPADARRDLDHPILGNFFVTLPVGIMIVATNAVLMGRSWLGPHALYGVALTAWWIGVLSVAILSVYVSYALVVAEQTLPHSINLSWLITPVAAVVMPLIGNPLVSMMQAAYSPWARTVHLVNLAFFGMGIMLYIFIGTIVLNRLIKHALPLADAAPTFWITLGPIGVGTVGLMGLADVSKSLGILGSTAELYLLAAAFWGFGLWAFGLAAAVTLHYRRRHGIPFSLSWWAFIFPLAAYTLGTLKVAEFFAAPVIRWYGAALTVLLAGLWTATAIATAQALWTGRLFLPPQNQGAAAPRK